MIPFRYLLLFGAALCVCTHLSAQTQPERYFRTKIDLTGRSVVDVAALGLEADHGQYAAGRFLISDYSSAELDLLRQAGIPYDVLIPDVQQHYANPNRSSVQFRGPGSCEPAPQTGGVRNYPVPSHFTLGSMGGFYTYQELLDILDQMQQLYPDLISLRDTIPGGASYEGRPIFWLKLSDNPNTDETDEPEVLYTALHHAREPNSITQMVYFLWYMLENYETSPEVRHLIEHTEMYFIPCINPDGYLYNETNNPQGGGLWRKNRRPNADGTFGVDLNRNYGFQWGYDNEGSSPAPGSEVYRGTQGFSEPETQAVRDFCIQHQFQAALNYHTFGNLLIFPWGYSDTPTADAPTFYNLTKAMTLENDFRDGTGSETVGYVVNGNSDDWMYGETTDKPRMFGMTPEVGISNQGFWPPVDQIIPNSQACMWMNLVLANAMHNFGLAYPLDDSYWTANTTTLPVQVERHGFVGGQFTLTLEALEPQLVSVANESLIIDLNANQFADTSFTIAIADNIPNGSILHLLLTIDNGHYLRTDTLRRVYYDLSDPLYSDPLSNLSGWQTNNTLWGLTTQKFYSAPTSLADSPNGVYANNSNNRIELSQPIIMGEAESVLLFFRASWDIESFYDYAQLQIKINNGSFFPACGRYTHPGSDFQDFEQPIYDGLQQDWVREEIDLSDLVQPGDAIRLRFVLGSDAFQQGDGFFVDDLAIYELAPDSTVSAVHTLSAADFNLSVSPNPAPGEYLQLQLSTPLESSTAVAVLFDALGREALRQEIKIMPGDSKFYLPTAGLTNGLYTLRLDTPQGFSKAIKVTIMK